MEENKSSLLNVWDKHKVLTAIASGRYCLIIASVQPCFTRNFEYFFRRKYS
ncbi:MAG: hypothetical protein AAF208_05455 [Cyanobacteria bacterium P01_A01_bin.45]